MKVLNYNLANNKKPSQNRLQILNPSTSEVYATVPSLSTSDIDYVYNSAKQSQIEWSNMTITKRAHYLRTWSELILQNKDVLSDMLVSEIAKSKSDSLTEIIRTCEYIEYTIEEMYRIDLVAKSSEQFYGQGDNKLAITRQIPLGVVLAISPFNYPINLAVSKIAPALISGNAVVFKPATQGSAVATVLYNLFLETGAPDGILGLVTGRGSEIGDYLVEIDKADMVSFTGGTNVGKRISSQLTMTPHVLELGGKDAAIILDESDIDLEFITSDIISGAFSYSGQRCTAIKRVLVPNSLYNDTIKLLVEKTSKLKVGIPQDDNTIVPIIDQKSADYIEHLYNDAIEKGAIELTPFKRNGNLISPTILGGVTADMDLYYEEPFGPLLPIITYETLQQAIEIHNDSVYGLQASIYGNNINAVLNLSEKLDAASININGKTSRGPDNFIFSGFKQSGFGAQGIRDSILSMTKPKTIVINK